MKMNETKFRALADQMLGTLQDEIEAEFDDADCSRSGNVLTVELESGGQVVINIQAPLQEIWLASYFGGHHFRCEDEDWIEAKSGRNLKAVAEEVVEKLRGR